MGAQLEHIGNAVAVTRHIGQHNAPATVGTECSIQQLNR